MADEKKQRILVVDDSEDIRDFFSFVLESAGYEVVTASSGDEGFAKAKETRPDLILLDVVMPGMDGLQTLLKLRSDLAPPVPPAILCSGFEITEAEALRRGALMFLPKPVTPSSLLLHVRCGLVGQRVDSEAAGRARNETAAARKRAHDGAAEALRRFAANARPGSQTLEQIATKHLPFIRRYFDLGTVVAAVLDGDHLLVVASAGDHAPPHGTALEELLPATREILETGGSLVLSDVSKHPCFSGIARALKDVRFFAGVPISSNGLAGSVTVGVLCFFDERPRQLEAEDLNLLQRIARNGSLILELQGRGRPPTELPGRFGAGVVGRGTFELMLDLELRRLERAGGSMELLVIDIADPSVVSESVIASPSGERLAAGALGPSRVGVFKRDLDGGAGPAMRELLRDISRRVVLHAAGAVTVGGVGLPALAGPDLLRLAELAFDHSFEADGGIRRFIVQIETAPLVVEAAPLVE